MTHSTFSISISKQMWSQQMSKWKIYVPFVEINIQNITLTIYFELWCIIMCVQPENCFIVQAKKAFTWKLAVSLFRESQREGVKQNLDWLYIWDFTASLSTVKLAIPFKSQWHTNDTQSWRERALERDCMLHMTSCMLSEPNILTFR